MAEALSVESFDVYNNPPLTESEIKFLQSDKLFAAKIQHILEKQIAILTASHASDCAVMVFPSFGLKQLEMKGEGLEWLDSTLQYLLQQLPPHLKQFGVSLVINGRNVQNQVSRHLLEHIASRFPVTIKATYLMKTAGILGIKKNVVNDAIAKKINLVYVYEAGGMLKHLLPRDLPTECGGALQYEHRQWTLFKLAEERMGYYCSVTSSRVEDLLLPMRDKVAVSCYDDVEVVLCQHLQLKESIVTEVNETRDVIQRFLEHLEKKEYVHATVMETQQNVAIVTGLQERLKFLDNEEASFATFWDHHKAILDHKIYLGDFLRSVEKVKSVLEGYMSDLTSETALGSRLEKSLEIGTRHEGFVTTVKETVDSHLHKLQDEGKHLRQPLTLSSSLEEISNPYLEETVARIEGGLGELGRQYEAVMRACQARRELCITCVKYFMAAGECEMWLEQCSGSQSKNSKMDDHSTEAVSMAISGVDTLLQDEPLSKVVSLQQITAQLKEKPFRKAGNKLVSKCQKTHDKLVDRRQHLLKILAASFQPPPPPPTDPASSTTGPASSTTGPAPPRAPPPSLTVSSSQPISPAALTDQDRPPLSSPDSLDTSSSRSDDHFDGSLAAMVSASWKSRKFVYEELVATENDYIHDLRSVVNGYYDDMVPDNSSVPVKLRGKARAALFGNIHKIQKFHRDVFSAELQKHPHHPEKIGEAFLLHGDVFSLYEDYCKNKPGSDDLLSQLTAPEELYLEGIQQSLGHQLPLSSYLLKPVQRITKYQLLLKDLIRHTTEDHLEEDRNTLMLALEKMLNILKYLNNSMKVIGLKGFPGNLVEQGRLLMQDVFHVTEVLAKGVGRVGRRRSIFPTGAKRHVFLFEKVVVFSKMAEGGTGQDGRQSTHPSYSYKAHIPVDDLSFRDQVEGQPNQLDLNWLSQHKLFQLISPSKEVKDCWTEEIRRFLEEQLKQAKNVAAVDKRLMKDTLQPAGDFRSGLSIERIGGTFRASIRRNKDRSRPTIAELEPGSAHSTLTRSTTAPVGAKAELNGSIELTRSSSVDSFESVEDNEEEGEDDDEEEEEEGEYPSTDTGYDTLAPGALKDFVAISNYNPGSAELDIGLVEGQQVEMLGVNQYGWSWVRATEPDHHTVVEGWVPTSYLKPMATNL